MQLLDYLTRRYPSLADSDAPAMPPNLEPPLPAPLLDKNPYLPPHLVRPSFSVIRHVINAARKSLK